MIGACVGFLCTLTFWHRNLAFKFYHILYVNETKTGSKKGSIMK
jgi:hypothetical protein